MAGFAVLVEGACPVGPEEKLTVHHLCLDAEPAEILVAVAAESKLKDSHATQQLLPAHVRRCCWDLHSHLVNQCNLIQVPQQQPSLRRFPFGGSSNIQIMAKIPPDGPLHMS